MNDELAIKLIKHCRGLNKFADDAKEIGIDIDERLDKELDGLANITMDYLGISSACREIFFKMISGAGVNADKIMPPEEVIEAIQGYVKNCDYSTIAAFNNLSE